MRGLRHWSLGLGEGMGWLWLFPAIGLLMLAIAMALVAARLKFETEAVRATGTVVELAVSSDSDGSGNTLCPVVEYDTRAGEHIRFVSGTCSRPARYRAGQPVDVLYRASAPERASLTGWADRWLGAAICAGIGGAFGLIGAFVVVPPLRRRRIGARLRVSGRPVEAQVSEVARDGSLVVGGRSPWRIHAQWQDPATRKVHVFLSEPVWFDPSRFVGDTVRVLVDPAAPGRYWLDTGFLPERA